MDIPSDLQLWRSSAREEQETFFRNLRCNGDYHCLNSPWEPGISPKEKNLRNLRLWKKIGFGLYGFTKLELCNSFADTGYSNYQGRCIKRIVKIIKTNCNCGSTIKIAPIMILSRKNRQRNSEIIFRFQVVSSEFPNKFIDSNAALYQNWEQLLEHHMLEAYDYCYPTNGLYSVSNTDTNLSLEFRKAVVDTKEEEVPLKTDSSDDRALCLIDPLKMDFTLQDVDHFVSSINFFFNEFYDTEDLWNHLQSCMEAVLDEVMKRLPDEYKIPFWRLCNENQIGYVIKSISEGFDPEKLLKENLFQNDKNKYDGDPLILLQNILRAIKEKNIKVNFLGKGLISIGDHLEISHITLHELNENHRELILSNQYQGYASLKKYKPELISKSETEQYIAKIAEALSSYCAGADYLHGMEINGCKIFNDMEFYLPGRLYKVLSGTCQKFNQELIAFGFRMVKYQKCSNPRDFCNIMEFAVAYLMEERARLEKEYQEELEKAQVNELFKLSTFREMYGIPRGTKDQVFFLKKALENLNSKSDYEMNAFFDDMKLTCHNELIAYDFKFSDISAAAYHWYKHRKFGKIELTEERYFALINKLLKKSPTEVYRVQEGGAFCEVFSDNDGAMLIRYRRSVTNPDGSVEDKCVVATMMHVKKKLEAIRG